MLLLALGINHKTAPISVRERVSFSPEQMEIALEELSAKLSLQGSVVLSTCNRTEIYVSVTKGVIESFEQKELDDESQKNKDFYTHSERVTEQLLNWLSEFHDMNIADIKNNIYCYEGEDAVRHLMRVSSGLDSLVIGEPQILGQVKDAYQLAKSKHKLPQAFSKWFEKSFSVAKRVRTETEIGAHAVSVAFAACSLARQIFEDLNQLNVLLVGAGETIELVSRHLNQHGVGKLYITNRTQSRAENIANQIGATVFPLTQIAENLHKVDIVISSTASSIPLITKEMVKSALKIRRYQPMLLIDIAVPRDISPDVADVESVYLYSVDDLQEIIAHNQSQRLQAAQSADVIIEQEKHQFMQWISSQYATESIREFRANAELIRQDLFDKAKNAIANGSDPIEEFEKMSFRLTQKLLHAPTTALQKVALESDKTEFMHLSELLKITPP
ncbi:glutamyl-tRNA reductase [Thorsellia anophelis]|uniref:Glutamyl-tRNA reductase n=1 Tax=Thorsellia anophelis DSM 18579 TaxID=1123402 RepID=A0A1I0EU67_9GAMM|nr:glutamyl-tRNA reductase [Thorsellia anophelis]SET48996.1 glutamyl-tRNA reductase [Thorsellia anophelis DSM 18579]